MSEPVMSPAGTAMASPKLSPEDGSGVGVVAPPAKPYSFGSSCSVVSRSVVSCGSLVMLVRYPAGGGLKPGRPGPVGSELGGSRPGHRDPGGRRGEAAL